MNKDDGKAIAIIEAIIIKAVNDGRNNTIEEYLEYWLHGVSQSVRQADPPALSTA